MMFPKPSNCVSSPKVRDKRWQNFDPLPVTVLLFLLAAVLIGLSSGELFLGFSVFPYVPSFIILQQKRMNMRNLSGQGFAICIDTAINMAAQTSINQNQSLTHPFTD